MAGDARAGFDRGQVVGGKRNTGHLGDILSKVHLASPRHEKYIDADESWGGEGSPFKS